MGLFSRFFNKNTENVVQEEQPQKQVEYDEKIKELGISIMSDLANEIVMLECEDVKYDIYETPYWFLLDSPVHFQPYQIAYYVQDFTTAHSREKKGNRVFDDSEAIAASRTLFAIKHGYPRTNIKKVCSGKTQYQLITETLNKAAIKFEDYRYRDPLLEDLTDTFDINLNSFVNDDGLCILHFDRRTGQLLGIDTRKREE